MQYVDVFRVQEFDLWSWRGLGDASSAGYLDVGATQSGGIEQLRAGRIRKTRWSTVCFDLFRPFPLSCLPSSRRH